MGEAPALFEDDLHENLSKGGILNSKGYKITIDVVCSKIYAIGATDCIPLPASFGEKLRHSDMLIDKFGPRIEDGKKPSLDGKTLFVTKAPFALVDQIGVQIFCKSSNEWVVPTMLGTIPKSSEGHSAIVLDEARILVIKGNTYSDDCFWFLEINTPFVRDQRTRLGTEVVAWSKAVIGKSKIPIVISGPSGVGKGTLISKLMEEFPSTFGFSVSHTTRAPRNSESNGVHYHFTERAVMESDIKDGKFLEFATVHGNLYGTSVEAVEVVTDGKKRCILDIDVQGARSVRATSLEAIFIFIRPPSFEELEQRLRTRGTETEEQIQKRLRNAKAEIDQGNSPGLFDHILVNDNLETCYQNLKEVLGLGDATKTNKTSVSELVHVTQKHAVSKNGQQIIINCTAPDQEESVANTFVLDISSIKGGAPGRTRGLNIYVAKPSSNGYKLPS